MTAETLDVEAAIRAAFDRHPDGTLEEIVWELGVPLERALHTLPAGMAAAVSGDRFRDIWAELADWGPVTFVVFNRDGVFEISASLPAGFDGHGYFNIHGDSPLGGHLRPDRCGSIWFVDRLFHGKRTVSLWFLNRDGEAMFKVFVGRDAGGRLREDQVARFLALRAREAG
jgi:putative heme utilization carrier protein HutX